MERATLTFVHDAALGGASRPARRHARVGPLAVLGLSLVGLAAGAWLLRHPLLTLAGRALVIEDPIEPAGVIVVSNANVRATALEAATLFREGVSGRILLLRWRGDRLDGALRDLGVAYLGFTELAGAILEHAGVPAGAITVLPDPVDGTSAEVAAVAAFARERTPGSVLYLTARSHTARARWSLRRALPPGTRVSVRSSRHDTFAPDGWWRQRETVRELATEYLRWLVS